jgi:TatA/E family protein of Tat protein translocase
MTLFGIGPIELLVILVLALIVFGPNRLPEIARSLGKAMSELRRTSQEVSETVMRELDVTPEPEQPQGAVPQIPASLRESVRKIVEPPQEAPPEEPQTQDVEPSDGAPVRSSQDGQAPDEGRLDG